MMTISIIGTGKIVKEVLEMFRQERLDIGVDAIFAHSNRETAQLLAQEYGIRQVYTDYQRMLEEVDSDFYYIANVNDQHYRYALQALQARRNVIVEKPVCLSSTELDELVGVAQKNGLYIFEAMTIRHMPNFAAHALPAL